MTNPGEAPELEVRDGPEITEEMVGAALEALREYGLLFPPTLADSLIVRKVLGAALCVKEPTLPLAS